MTAPDWKPAARVVDRRMSARVVLAHPWCVVCGLHGGTCHHVLPRSERGDDVDANGVTLCGSGTTGCHGLVEARDPAARAAVGKYVLRDRSDTIEYLDGKLGGLDRALDYLRRHYGC